MHPAIAVPVTLALVIRSYTRKSLTLPGILAAALTAIIHALYPSSLPFTLLVVFFLLGTTATKVKHEIKANLTLSSTGSAGGESTRTTIQVLANSGVASTLILLHLIRYGTSKPVSCFGGHEDNISDILLLGIISNYAAVTADTLSSELGILSKSHPRLITAPWRVVPPGTNGGVTFAGLTSGMAGSFVIGLLSVSLISFCSTANIFNTTVIGHKPPQKWHLVARLNFVLAVTIWGTLGSVLDSILGAVFQASVVDRRTGKVVEGTGGAKVLYSRSDGRRGGSGAEKDTRVLDTTKRSSHEESRTIGSGRDVLDNNQVNVLMALLMSLGGVVGGLYFFNVPVTKLFTL